MDVILARIAKAFRTLHGEIEKTPEGSSARIEGETAAFLFNSHIQRPEEYQFRALGRVEIALIKLEAEISSSELKFPLGVIDGLFKLFYDLDSLDIEDHHPDTEVVLAYADGLATKLVSEYPDWQYVSGFSGVALYLLRRYRKKKHLRKPLRAYVSRMKDLAVADADGIFWKNLHYHAPEYKGGVVLGNSHGTSGPINLLARIHLLGIEKKMSGDLMKKSVSWLQSLADTEGQRWLPHFCHQSGKPKIRQAWCYGNPGIAYSLMLSGIALEDNGILDFSRQLALNALEDYERLNSLHDLGLCHGLAGLGQLYRRIDSLSPDAGFKKASLHFTRLLLDQLSEAREFPEHEFMLGKVGIAYYLGDIIGFVPAAWDAVLLSHLPESE